MNAEALTLVVGGILVVVVSLVIVKRFGRAILAGLAVVGLVALAGLALGVLRPGVAGQPVANVANVDPAPVPATPEPAGWLGALRDVAAIVTALRPAPQPAPQPAAPQPAAPQPATAAFCAGGFAALAVLASGALAILYRAYRAGGSVGGLGDLLRPGQRQADQATVAPAPTMPAFYWIDVGQQQDRRTVNPGELGEEWGF